VTAVISQRDLDHVRRRYEDRIAVHGPTFASLSTGGADKQTLRHRVHASVLPNPECSILDVGAGLGHFYRYLKENGFRGTYHGIDIVPDYVRACQADLPDAKWEVRNVFEEGFGGVFDVITLCQALNTRLPHSDNNTAMREFLRTACQSGARVVSVDMLTTYVDFRDPNLSYYDPSELFAFAKTLVPYVRLRHDYLPYEFTLQLFRERPSDL